MIDNPVITFNGINPLTLLNLALKIINPKYLECNTL